MRVYATDWVNSCGPVVEDVQPEDKRLLLTTFLIDLDGQEDLYLAEIAKAEAGETIIDLYNHFIHVYMYPDRYPNQVVLEEMSNTPEEGEDSGTPRRSVDLTLAQTKQLIMDWLAAKKQWREQNPEPQASPSASSPQSPAS
jgi:hypothetical protein